jgi:hypothetical protein
MWQIEHIRRLPGRTRSETDDVRLFSLGWAFRTHSKPAARASLRELVWAKFLALAGDRAAQNYTNTNESEGAVHGRFWP